MIRAILFDLDGTLLPMDIDEFAEAYIGGLVRCATGAGFDKDRVKDGILKGIFAMVKNDGRATNEQVFFRALAEEAGEEIYGKQSIFDGFYMTDFQKIRDICGTLAEAGEIIELVKGRGLRAVLATNPLFPAVATESRIRWAGLSPEDFELFTSYESSHYCKPNPDYYREVLDRLALSPDECVMVGNDAEEDMIAGTLGIKTFLLTNDLINRKGVDINRYNHGGTKELIKFLRELV
ncbi:MAG: HAD family hydrolase [Clostridia bacterium]|nr:HAD family hydrolase [Clostridia bacterium]